MGSWGKLDPLGGHQGDLGEGDGRVEPAHSPWGRLDFHPPEESRAARSSGVDVLGSGHRLPPPEATASLLTAGEMHWARADNTGVRLGSGQQLRTVGAYPQHAGWCRVEIVDPLSLTARVLPVATIELRSAIGDDPDLVYQPGPVGEVAGVPRHSSFPVGQGPALREIFERRVAAAEGRADERATRAEQWAGQQVAAVERQAGHRLAEVERAATSRASEIDRIKRASTEQVAAARVETDRARASVAALRRNCWLVLGLAGVGWLLAVVVFMVR